MPGWYHWGSMMLSHSLPSIPCGAQGCQHPLGRRDVSHGTTKPLRAVGPAGLCSIPLVPTECSHPFLSRPEALGALLLLGVAFPGLGLCMSLWKGAGFTALPSLPVAARVDTRAPVSLGVNLCRWQLMFLPCPLQQMARFSVGYLYPRLIFLCL